MQSSRPSPARLRIVTYLARRADMRRRLDGPWGEYQWCDRAPRGRNEAGIWWRRHHEYPR